MDVDKAGSIMPEVKHFKRELNVVVVLVRHEMGLVNRAPETQRNKQLYVITTLAFRTLKKTNSFNDWENIRTLAIE